MRFSVFIAACAVFLASEGALRFTSGIWREDLGVALPCLEGAVGEPLDMPRASAYLVTNDGAQFLEDRYDSFDLWSLRTMRARWRDANGNRLYVARLNALPLNDAEGTVRTRTSFRDALKLNQFDVKQSSHRDLCAQLVSPVDLGMAVKARRSQRHNIKEVVSYAVTNDNAVAFAFRPVRPGRGGLGDWYLAVLVANENEDMSEVRARFDEDFLDNVFVPGERTIKKSAGEATKGKTSRKRKIVSGEAELLRSDVRSQVANYDEWAFHDSEDVTILDNLEGTLRTKFVTALTNELPILRKEFAMKIPSPLVATNALALVRVFRSREDYLAYVGVGQKWTAAVWSPLHRELVMYHPEEGTDKLLSTVRHEAFHQYLAYAGSMIEASPWFNEGHAQLFQNIRFDSNGGIEYLRDNAAVAYIKEYAKQLAEILPDVLKMDYAEFYAGEQDEVIAKYRVAWSVAYFLEIGAPKIRFRPYENLRADYMKALIKTRSMHEATDAVLGDEKSRDKFVAAWLAFWCEL